ncbi:hypothetical protein O3M35_002168 [Rhynocoris fuscipes]|uniref:Protein brambleberry n=1 Tax=Rhynocoris fuscipes TaxID=488301 RepID=A0AAW1CRB5_9HEMI
MLKRCFLLFVILDTSYSSVLDWLGFGTTSTNPSVNHFPFINVPFEELDPEEKFLVEASKITGLKLDELDVCQQKLILKLKTSCGELSDEQLSKLAVGLLNCQSEIEGRKVYPCSPNMKLRDCTRDMDPETWNSYHVISNRARAVCYAVRQEQFRALAEMTINKLMTVSHEHIGKMALVEEKQMKLGQSTESVLNQVLNSQTKILSSYSNLKKMESSLISSIAYGVNRVEYQKELLLKLQEVISNLMDKFQHDMDNANNKLSERTSWNIEQHKSLISSLVKLNRTAEDIARKLKESKEVLQEREDVLLSKTEAAITSLNNINISITNMAEWISYFEEVGRPRYHWLRDIIGDKGHRLDLISVLIFHVCGLLLAMLICSFLSVPFTSRWLLCITAPLNLYLATSNEYQEYSSTVLQFYLAFLIIVISDYSTRFLYNLYKNLYKTSPHSSPFSKTSLTSRLKENTSTFEIKNRTAAAANYNGRTDIHSKVNAWLSERNSVARNGHLLSAPFLSTVMDESNRSEILDDKRESYDLPPPSVCGSSRSVKSRCSAICKSGVPCRNPVYGHMSTRCRVHGRGSSEHR